MGAPVELNPAIVPPDADVLGRGCWAWDVPGARVIFPLVHADPLKDDADWLEEQAGAMPRAEFDREYLGDFSVFTGKPVFEREYRDHLHLSKEPLPYLPNRPIVRGWDIPGPLACVWMQLHPVTARRTPDPVPSVEKNRLFILAEAYAPMGVTDFGNYVKNQSAVMFPKATQYIDWSDPAAWAETTTSEQRSASTILRELGIYLNPGPTNLIARLEPLRWWLTQMVVTDSPGQPPGAVLIDPSCTMIRDGLRSGYHYAEIEKSGRFKEVPEKNEYSHPIDALTYGVANVVSSGTGAAPKSKPIAFERTAVLGAR